MLPYLNFSFLAIKRVRQADKRNENNSVIETLINLMCRKKLVVTKDKRFTVMVRNVCSGRLNRPELKYDSPLSYVVEKFSIDCRKTKTTLANHKERRQIIQRGGGGLI